MKFLRDTRFYLVALFLAGLLAGACLGYSAARYQIMQPLKLSRLSKGIQAELTSKLGLDSAQQEKMRPLVERSIGRIQGIYSNTMGEIELVLQDSQHELESFLRPDQKAKMSDLAASREEYISKHNPLTPPVKNQP